MPNIKISELPPAIGVTTADLMEIVQAGTSKRATALQVNQATLVLFPATIEFIIDGGGSAITTGTKGYLEIPFNGTITEVTLLADRVGSIVVDVWKCTQTQFDAGATHPVAGDSITDGAKPTIVAGTKYQDTSLPGWITALAGDDILAFNVNSNSAINRITISLKVTREI